MKKFNVCTILCTDTIQGIYDVNTLPNAHFKLFTELEQSDLAPFSSYHLDSRAVCVINDVRTGLCRDRQAVSGYYKTVVEPLLYIQRVRYSGAFPVPPRLYNSRSLLLS